MQEKIRLVFGMNNLAVGGAQYQLIRQLQFFDLNRFEIHVILLVNDSERSNLNASIPTEVQIHQLSFNGFADIPSWTQLYKKLRELEPHLVVSSFFFSNTVFRIQQLFLGFPVISREHNTYVNKPQMHILIDRILATRTKKIVAVSKEVADFTAKQENIPRDKFVVINNGIDLAEIDHVRLSVDTVGIKKELGVGSSDKIALHVSRLVRQKNQTLLIQGFSLFYKNNRNWRLLIVGGGGLIDELKQLVKDLRLDDAVIFTGEQKNVHPYYAISDCFISTSKIEGMSNTHLEALAHGLPILSTRTGGTSSIVRDGENGYFIAESTEEAVLETLEKFEKSDRRTMAEKSRVFAQQFDIKNTVKQYEGLFATYARKI